MVQYGLPHIGSYDAWMAFVHDTVSQRHAWDDFFLLDGCPNHILGRWSYAGCQHTQTIEGHLSHDGQLDALKPFLPHLSACEEHPQWVGVIYFDGSLRFAHYPTVWGWDHRTQRGYAWSTSGLCQKELSPPPTKNFTTPKVSFRCIYDESPDKHRQRILEAHQRMNQGLLYEVNLARKVVFELSDCSPAARWAFWNNLRRASSVPLGAYISMPSHSIMSRSMELFFDWDPNTRRLESRPIKGTVQRKTVPASFRDEEAEIAKLLASEKESAEHIMVVDLVRNDMGQVAVSGSVQVEAFRAIESYHKLHHSISTVACLTKQKTTLKDVLSALFPPASVTGTPKLQALKAISDLESDPRGVYTGAIGYMTDRGRFRASVAIRTATLNHERRQVSYWAGGGIVESSDPDQELEEINIKSRVFFDALTGLSSTSVD